MESALLPENQQREQQPMNEINKELINIADKLNISKRIDPVNNTPAFISLKDHMPDLENHPKRRLINPCKASCEK